MNWRPLAKIIIFFAMIFANWFLVMLITGGRH